RARLATCVGGAGHIAKYAGGDLDLPCGAIIDGDQITAGSWTDPNLCTRTDTPHVFGPGRRFRPAVRGGGGAVASPSRAASEAGQWTAPPFLSDFAPVTPPIEPFPSKGDLARFELSPSAAQIYLKAGALPYIPGDRLIQRDYARSLALIAKQGPDAFYRGPIA